ncbi:CAP domain-containing protein [Flavobacterium frigoris]|uniref:Allergen V5/Tpx-1 family protein n=1 Tax=Flavobacterium frigoris (strain PS1) TaxID=1086011 RepID=H7FQC4_FLAFP|nr:CAP domain-containing protein [Flavobacterium frigoris]EIA09478.1 allergen V5/Tpx-1 family protein [Flavobacterium frigoris PS1]
MNFYFLRTFLFITVIFTMNSCSSDSSETQTVESTTQKMVNYNYSASEIETMKLINEYRVSVGLNVLEKIDFISLKSEEHDNYMIANNVVSHDGFVTRAEEIKKVLSAKGVGENIAYNYSTAQSALNAWLASPGHKENIEGDYTHFGIAIRENPTTGKKYYTNIFAKI